jgi:hypothetical protein
VESAGRADPGPVANPIATAARAEAVAVLRLGREDQAGKSVVLLVWSSVTLGLAVDLPEDGVQAVVLGDGEQVAMAVEFLEVAEIQVLAVVYETRSSRLDRGGGGCGWIWKGSLME